jgi:MHS family citrate/tricarballylate:H+ symporter-like MFS transporter
MCQIAADDRVTVSTGATFRGQPPATGGTGFMAPTAVSATPQIKSRIGAILRATSGNFLEQFDFFLFGFYAAAIGKAFFRPTMRRPPCSTPSACSGWAP